MERVGGIIQVQANGEILKAKGNYSYNLGLAMREAVVGADGHHGYKETPQPGFIEGEITDGRNLSLSRLVTMRDATVTLSLPNGKMVACSPAYFAGEGTANTEEGNIPVRWEGPTEEVK